MGDWRGANSWFSGEHREQISSQGRISAVTESSKLMDASRRDGAFVSVKNINEISSPQLSMWRYYFEEEREEVVDTGKYITTNRVNIRKSWVCASEPFFLVNTLEVGNIYLAWDKVESYSIT